jgi:predicted glycoside hydrolase/deacetylase ChbG (UPF0249 family)
MAGARCVIVNADDFGQNAGVNQGIIASHERGIVTSASLMVRWPAAAEAAAYARRHPSLSLGLHLDLGEWVYKEGAWQTLYEVVLPGDAQVCGREIARQLEAFCDLVGAVPTHLDSHQHCHREEPVRSLLETEARRLHVPLRSFDPVVRYCGDFYGQTDTCEPHLEAIGVDALIQILRTLPPGVTEVACHPALGDTPAGMYRSERHREVETLCDPRVRAVLASEDIRLCSFADLSLLTGSRS